MRIMARNVRRWESDGERLKVLVTKNGKSLYPIVVKQQKICGIHHLLYVMKGSFGSVPRDRGFPK